MSRTRLWRAVNQDGDVLDILVQSRRDNKAAKKFFRKLLQGLRYVPNIIITDKLKSYSVAEAAANTSSRSIRTTEERIRINQKVAERVMRRFKSAGQAQRFLSAFGVINSHFRLGPHLCSAGVHVEMMKRRLAVWEEVVIGSPAV